jgi:hypothetical protein
MKSKITTVYKRVILSYLLFYSFLFFTPQSINAKNIELKQAKKAPLNLFFEKSGIQNPTFCLKNTAQNSTHKDTVPRKSLIIGIPLTHFSPKNYHNELDYNIRFISPGIEALFQYSLNNSINFSTGLSYQYNKITYGEHSSDIKTITNEISIPFLISLKLLQSTIPDMELAAGFYLGQFVTISNNIYLFGHNKKNYATLFSADDFIADIYVAIGKELFLKKIPIGFDLFFRYRLKKHQIVNHEVSQSFYGIKLKYALNL